LKRRGFCILREGTWRLLSRSGWKMLDFLNAKGKREKGMQDEGVVGEVLTVAMINGDGGEEGKAFISQAFGEEEEK